MPLIALEEISFSYAPEENVVLDHFSLQVERGECLVLLGDNGSGKTTLFRILNGLSFPQSGRFLLDGETIDRAYLSDNRREKRFHQRVGYLFQNPDVMLFNARVADEIAFGPRQMGLAEAEIEKRTEDCLALFSLAALRDRAPYHLSAGQKKRVALAAVLALNPEILVLDEPFAGLDQRTTGRVLSLLRDWKAAGKTILLSTHDRAEVAEVADRFFTLGADA